MADHGKIFLLVPSLVFLLLAFETEVYHDKNGGQGAYSEQELAAATASEQRVAAGRSGEEERRRGEEEGQKKKKKTRGVNHGSIKSVKFTRARASDRQRRRHAPLSCPTPIER